jgi:hypothetical protein
MAGMLSFFRIKYLAGPHIQDMPVAGVAIRFDAASETPE